MFSGKSGVRRVEVKLKRMVEVMVKVEAICKKCGKAWNPDYDVLKARQKECNKCCRDEVRKEMEKWWKEKNA